MSAWLLAALMCAPVSAQVVETGGAAVSAAPVSGAVGTMMGAGGGVSPIASVPGASLLAPSLNTGAAIKAFGGTTSAQRLPAGAMGLAPLPALPAAAALADAAPGAESAPNSLPAGRTENVPAPGVPVSREQLPPVAISAQAPIPAAAVARHRIDDSEGVAAAAVVRGVDGELAQALGLARVSAETALTAGRRLFDRAGDHAGPTDPAAFSSPAAPLATDGAALAQTDAAPALKLLPVGSVAPSGFGGGETLRDAVASPVPAVAGPGTAFSFFRAPGAPGGPVAAGNGASSAFAAPGVAAPLSFSRLSLELGSGLVVKVRAVLGLPPSSSARPFAAAERAGAPAASRAVRRAPITSTEWLERRGLLESLSASEAAAVQTADALSRSGPAPTRAAESASTTLMFPLVLPAAAPARVPPFAWWSLAFLPAAVVLLKELF